MELGFEKIKPKLVKEIILGPKCTINPIDLKIFLAANKYINDIDDDSIVITRSNIPYR
jgi:hypothetical protein